MKNYVITYANSKGRTKFYQIYAGSKDEALTMAESKIPPIARGDKQWKIKSVDLEINNQDFRYVDERGFFSQELKDQAIAKARESAKFVESALSRGIGGSSTSST